MTKLPIEIFMLQRKTTSLYERRILRLIVEENQNRRFQKFCSTRVPLKRTKWNVFLKKNSLWIVNDRFRPWGKESSPWRLRKSSLIIEKIQTYQHILESSSDSKNSGPSLRINYILQQILFCEYKAVDWDHQRWNSDCNWKDIWIWISN